MSGATELAFVDTETTGLDPRRHEVWEVAIIEATHHHAVAEDDDGKGAGGRLEVTAAWLRQLRTARLEQADPYGLKVGGFHDRRAPTSQHLTVAKAALQIERRTRGRMIVGAVPSFDVGFLTPLLHDAGYPVTWHYQLIDVETLVAGSLAGSIGLGEGAPPRSGVLASMLGRATPPWDSDELLRTVGAEVDDEHRHTALGDARWALDAYASVFALDVDWASNEVDL